MKYRYIIPAYLIAFFLQSAVLIQFELFDSTPNLLLCLTVLITFWDDGYTGMILGIIFGLIQDICFGRLIGTAALCYFVITLIIMMTKHLLYKNNALSLSLLTAISTLMYSILYWGISAIMVGDYHFFYTLKNLPFVLLYNCAFVLIVNLFFRRKSRKYPEDKYS